MLYHIIAASNEIRGARTTGGTSSKVLDPALGFRVQGFGFRLAMQGRVLIVYVTARYKLRRAYYSSTKALVAPKTNWYPPSFHPTHSPQSTSCTR